MKRIHLDTDLGSDTDDLAALAMLLGWSDVELTGITTVSDPDGRRAGMTAYALDAGRPRRRAGGTPAPPARSPASRSRSRSSNSLAGSDRAAIRRRRVPRPTR